MTIGQILRKIKKEINSYDKPSQAKLNAWLDCFARFAGEALNFVDEKDIDSFIKLLIKAVYEEKLEAVLLALRLYQEMESQEFLDQMFEIFLEEAKVYIGGMATGEELRDFFARVFELVRLYHDKARAKELEEKSKKKLIALHWLFPVPEEKPKPVEQKEKEEKKAPESTTSSFLDFFTLLFGKGFAFKSILDIFKETIFGINENDNLRQK